MANRRNRSRKNSRKSRRATRRNRRQNAGAIRRNGLISKVYSPIHELLGATGNAVGIVTNTTRNIARKGLKGVNNIGLTVTGRANQAVRGVFSRKRRANNRR